MAEEYHVLGTGEGFHHFQEFCYRSTAPLGNAAPPLNAVVLRDLFAETDFTQLIDCQFLGMRNFAEYLQRAALWTVL